MKNYAVILLVVLCPFFPVQGHIINGYLFEKQKLEQKIKASRNLLEEAETTTNRRKIEKELKHLQKEYKTVLRKYVDTQEVIDLVRQIDPDLYDAVSKVANAKGTLTHVYVRCTYPSDPEFEYFADNYFDALAYTSASPATNDVDDCCSQYGLNTITITIGSRNDKAIELAHEFAHVLYIVPNLRSYSTFLEKASDSRFFKMLLPGHHPCDPSHYAMDSVELKFKVSYANYKKNLQAKNE